jgi:hypothetical protein
MTEQTVATQPVTVKQVRDALAISFVSEKQVILQLQNNSPVAVAVLKIALEHLPKDAVVTLDLQKLNSLPSELIQNLLKCGAVGSCLAVTPKGHTALLTLNLVDEAGVSQVPDKFRWQVTSTPVQAGYDRRDLSDRLVQAVAKDILASSSGIQSLKDYQKHVELTKSTVQRQFSVEEVNGIYEVRLTAPLTSELARTTFVDFLKDQLPEEKVCRIDLTVLGRTDQGLCNSILMLSKSRQRGGSPPLELVVPAELQRIFSPLLDAKAGFSLVASAAQHQ